jgi:hypothetical protein
MTPIIVFKARQKRFAKYGNFISQRTSAPSSVLYLAFCSGFMDIRARLLSDSVFFHSFTAVTRCFQHWCLIPCLFILLFVSQYND